MIHYVVLFIENWLTQQCTNKGLSSYYEAPVKEVVLTPLIRKYPEDWNSGYSVEWALNV